MLNRKSVAWGGFSLTNCILELLKKSTNYNYEYYHLLSGADLPLKKQDEIHKFFNENKGKNYISFDDLANKNKIFLERIKYYYFFQELIGRNKVSLKILILKSFNRISLLAQKILRVNRINKYDFEFKKGECWFSISNSLAKYIVSNEGIIKKISKNSFASDEIFLQTIAWNSSYRDTIVFDCSRFIDWKRGSPYVFTDIDYQDLINSDCFWARKFDLDKDPYIVNNIYNEIKL